MTNNVTTFDGTVAKRTDCRYIKGEYYIKNKQCFFIGDTWYRINSGMILFDYEKQQWVLSKGSNLIKGIVGFDEVNNDFIIGHFSPDPFKNVDVLLPNGIRMSCLTYKLLPSSFVEDTESMMFVHKSLAPKKTKKPRNTFGNHGYPYQLPYCTKHYDPALMEMIVSNTNKALHYNTTNISSYVREIDNYTFGFEFETNSGKIPNYRIAESGLVPLRDGSIQGVEYATIVLQGVRGMATLENACSLLNKYTNMTENESLHLHIGNIPSGKKFIGYLYTLCCLLEEDIFSLFPMYYAKTSMFKQRGKDYNMPLRKELVSFDPIETFNNIAYYLSDGKRFQGIGMNHPSDPDGNQKWNIQSRYHFVNFIPLLFGDNRTIEFRCHVPTRDPIKVINWLYICSAIIKYAKMLSDTDTDINSVRGITLSKVVRSQYTASLAAYLDSYISFRMKMRKDADAKGDFTGRSEIMAENSSSHVYFEDIK